MASDDQKELEKSLKAHGIFSERFFATLCNHNITVQVLWKLKEKDLDDMGVEIVDKVRWRNEKEQAIKNGQRNKMKRERKEERTANDKRGTFW